jgi:hypothetical protein
MSVFSPKASQDKQQSRIRPTHAPKNSALPKEQWPMTYLGPFPIDNFIITVDCLCRFE